MINFRSVIHCLFKIWYIFIRTNYFLNAAISWFMAAFFVVCINIICFIKIYSCVSTSNSIVYHKLIHCLFKIWYIFIRTNYFLNAAISWFMAAFFVVCINIICFIKIYSCVSTSNSIVYHKLIHCLFKIWYIFIRTNYFLNAAIS